MLISGAAGGVGTAAVQLAAAAGASVVAASAIGPGTTRSPWGPAWHRPGRSAHGPYDVVLELVGAASLATVLPHLAIGGRVVVIGVGSGAKLELNLLQLMGAQGHASGAPRCATGPAGRRPTCRPRGRPRAAPPRGGRVRVPVWATFPLREAGAAYDRFAAGGKLGKIVLVPDPWGV